MQHWFVEWLKTRAERSMQKANFYRESFNSNSEEAKNLLEAFEDSGIEEVIEWAQMFEEDSRRFLKWSEIIADMINCGLEECAFRYYDAKQAIEPGNLPPRPQKVERLKSSNIAYQLELIINEKGQNSKDMAELQTIYETVVEIDSMGLEEVAVQYYLRKRQANPELNLPDSDVQFD